MEIKTGKIVRPQKVVAYGPEGIGKTTLASKFPDPLFIDTEGSTIHLDVKRADPAPTSWSMLLAYIDNVIAVPSLCKTLVIDTADWAERLCVEHVLSRNQWNTIEAPGYGKGYREVNEEFGRLLDKLSDVVDKGVNVVVTAHARIAKFEQPDELGAYDRWSLKLFDSPKSSNAAMLKEWADMVLFLNYKTNIVKPDSKTGGHAKAVGGQRVMYATHTPAWDAKNRCGLPDEMPMEFSSIAACIPGSSQSASAPQPAAAPQPTPASQSAAGDEGLGDLIESVRKAEEDLAATNAKIAADKAKRQAEKDKAAQTTLPVDPEPEKPPEEPAAPSAPAIDTSPPAAPSTPAIDTSTDKGKLLALMAETGVEVADVQAYSERMGYCPTGTPFDNYPVSYYKHLLTNWQSVLPEVEKVPFERSE